jgi:pseudaminic acid cytidylyltransferase
MPDALAIIPARGGSKRLPRKNILDFHGKPILAYTIEAAFRSGLFKKVIVSTEDAEIAEIAAKYHAEVAVRKPDLATDAATVAQVCENVLLEEQGQGRVYDILCCLYATAPLRCAEDIAATVALLEKGACRFAIAATHYSHYPHQALIRNSDGYLVPRWPEWCDLRGSEVGELLAGNGSTYAVFVEDFLREKDFYGPGMRAHIMPFVRSIDIDTAEDFELAWCLAKCAAMRDAGHIPR